MPLYEGPPPYGLSDIERHYWMRSGNWKRDLATKVHHGVFSRQTAIHLEYLIETQSANPDDGRYCPLAWGLLHAMYDHPDRIPEWIENLTSIGNDYKPPPDYIASF